MNTTNTKEKIMRTDNAIPNKSAKPMCGFFTCDTRDRLAAAGDFLAAEAMRRMDAGEAVLS